MLSCVSVAFWNLLFLGFNAQRICKGLSAGLGKSVGPFDH